MLKLATFNINNVTRRLPQLLHWLERASPDIVCLQETKVVDARFPAAAVREAGYRARWHGEPLWNGVAILAKGVQPIETRRGLPGDPSDRQSRYLETAIFGMVVANLYLPNGNPQPGPKFAYKLAWFERFLSHARALKESGHPVVLAGDYNVVPTDFDIYNPKSWRKNALLQPESRACYQRLLDQGWLDTLRAQHPDQRIYTFWDYFRQHRERNAGLRLDHILLSPSLVPRLRESGVDDWVRDLPDPSDHAPAWVTLDDADGPKRSRR
jgi:exodeoxyribonuclease III